jgi:hypothetical protein
MKSKHKLRAIQHSLCYKVVSKWVLYDVPVAQLKNSKNYLAYVGEF